MEKAEDPCHSSEVKSKPVILSDKLFNLIASVTKIEPVTNVKEILDGLKTYILKKQLYDPQNPIKIRCENDELGSVLGVQEFSVPDVNRLLQKVVSPVYPGAISNSVNGINSKRKLEGSSADIKKCRHDEIIIYIPPSPTRDSESSDSAESFQGYETAIVKDTSDESIGPDSSDDNFSIIAVQETYNIEYEVNSLSSLSSGSSSSWSDSDSETDSLSSAIITVICKGDSDMEFWADKSSDEDFYGFDAEISDSDKWKCSKCSTLNDPTNRFCERCFETRKGWLANKRQPAKRKSRSKRKRVSTSDRTKQTNRSKLNSVSPSDRTEQKESTQNNPINICEFPSTSSTCQENKSPHCTETKKKHSNNYNFDSNNPINIYEFPSTSSACQENKSHDCFETGKKNSNNDNSDSNSSSKICFLCCERPANGIMIHNHTKFAHTIACYLCAKKLKNLKKPCPICRRSIDRVVYQILP